jgi:hypothetical protein
MTTMTPLASSDIGKGNNRYCGRFLNANGIVGNVSVCSESFLSKAYYFKYFKRKKEIKKEREKEKKKRERKE